MLAALASPTLTTTCASAAVTWRRRERGVRQARRHTYPAVLGLGREPVHEPAERQAPRLVLNVQPLAHLLWHRRPAAPDGGEPCAQRILVASVERELLG